MARPADTTVQRALRLIAALGVVAALPACSKQDKQEPPQATTNQPAASAPAAKAVSGDGNLHCDDFLSPADLSALGLTKNEPSELVSDSTRLACRYKGSRSLSVYVLRGDELHGDDRNSHASSAKGSDAIAAEPKIGAGTAWSEESGMHMVVFVPTSRKFTARVVCGDEQQIVKVSNVLLAKLDKMQ